MGTTGHTATMAAMAVARRAGDRSVATAPGLEDTVFLKPDGTVWATGNNDIGQLGANSSARHLGEPRPGQGRLGCGLRQRGRHRRPGRSHDGLPRRRHRVELGQQRVPAAGGHLDRESAQPYESTTATAMNTTKECNVIECWTLMPKLRAALALVSLTASGWAQEPQKPGEIKAMCPTVIATVMVAKVNCSAALCNTGSAQGGWLGLATAIAHRGNTIDGASFSVGFGAQLSTALKQTGCFTVLDAAGLEDARKELEALGRPLPPSPTVDYLVRSDITRAELLIDESSLLGYKWRTAKSSLGLDTKLVNAASGAVFEAGSYDAAAERKSSGVDIGIYRSGDDAARRATPFAEVSRDLVIKTTLGLTSRILSQPAPVRAAANPAEQGAAPAAGNAASAASAASAAPSPQ